MMRNGESSIILTEIVVDVLAIAPPISVPSKSLVGSRSNDRSVSEGGLVP
jgi:hypothetical protein